MSRIHVDSNPGTGGACTGLWQTILQHSAPSGYNPHELLKTQRVSRERVAERRIHLHPPSGEAWPRPSLEPCLLCSGPRANRTTPLFRVPFGTALATSTGRCVFRMQGVDCGSPCRVLLRCPQLPGRSAVKGQLRKHTRVGLVAPREPIAGWKIPPREFSDHPLEVPRR